MADKDQVVQLLSSVPYFRNLDATSQDAIAEAAKRREYFAEETVIKEGDESAGLFIVEQGYLKSIKLSVAGRQQVVRVVGPGEVFNAIGVLASDTNPGTVIALEPAVVWSIGRQDLLQLMDEHPGLAGAIIHSLANRIQQLMQQVEDLSLRSVDERLARLLLEEAEDGTVLRRQWDTQAEMAARLGTVADVLNRSLRRMAEAGMVEVEREQIRLLDIAALKELAALEI